MLCNGFPERIRKLRGDRTKADMSRLVGVSRHSWDNYETGRKAPRLEIFYDICKACNVSADYLLGLEDMKMHGYKELVDGLRNMSVVDSLMKPELEKAADAIEELYEKLKYMNCDGEWVYCFDDKELPSESGKYNVIVNSQGLFTELEFDAETRAWKDGSSNVGYYVIAWWRKYEFEI